ncbi:MAG TPA: hypothetical protein ENJ95_19940 [Bacteroidetes bacterium]|nr:hypothetical protein [Bacteroidota bacterium]
MKRFDIKHLLAAAAFLLAANTLFAQRTLHQVYMFGNFADVPDKPAFTQKLDKLLGRANAPFTLILNGDLVNAKIGKYDHQEQIEPVFKIADMVDKYEQGNLLIVPGDRDWNSGQKGGEKSLRHLERRVKDYLKEKKYKRAHWAVKDGCPGPKVYEMGEALAIIVLNTQWWNHPFDKPRATDAVCDGLSQENLKEELEDAVEDYQDRNVLIVGHHPFYSLGNYGGRFSLLDHFKPLPVAGLFTTAFHANVGGQFDLANERLHPLFSGMVNLFYFHDNLIYAGGHEKNQQVWQSGGNYLINSGAPASAKYATKDENTVLSEKAAGIMQLNYYSDGKVEAVFWENNESQAGGANTGFYEKEKRVLFHSSCKDSPSENALLNTAFVPCKDDEKATGKMLRKHEDMATVPAGDYAASAWKRIWFGKHYRTSWTQPVTVPYLDLDETFGGLTIYKKGGGRQTTSLKFRAADGSVYTFRSVDKDPKKALNHILRNTFAAGVVQDFTSTQQPYGAMGVAPLLEKIGVLHATPVLYRLPDDPKLGPFQAKYGHLLGMLEENPGKKNRAGRHFGEADKIEKSVGMFSRFYRDHDAYLEVGEFVRARLFDILVGDWSKHEDNWKWAAYKTEKGRKYRPIPRDRDHVFSRQDGVINWLADRPFGMQNIENFGHDFTGLKSLVWQERHMDRYLMQEATKPLFLEQAKYIQEHISEEDIDRAVRNMPPEVLELSGKEIAAKLKNRIRHLPEATKKYYAILAKEVDVTGSKQKEYFAINHQRDGSVRVQMFNVKKGEKGKKLLFDRTFFPAETKEVRVWGLGGDDVFDIGGEGRGAKIKVRAFGGPGDDVFKNTASAKSLLYDKGIGTKYELSGGAKVAKHWNKDVYEYNRQQYEYNHFLPLLSLVYSSYTGFGLGLSGSWTLQKFGKEGYASKHKAAASFTTKGNLSASYSGRFHQAIRRWDFLVDVFTAQPQLQNRFYGLGNSSVNMDGELGVKFYKTAVNTEHFSLGLARGFWQKSSLEIRAGVERNESERIADTFLDGIADQVFGARRKLTTLPVTFKLDLDFRDEKGLPYNGARLVLGYQNNVFLNGTDADGFGVADGEMEYYFSTKKKHPVTVGLRAGGAVSHGDVPWYKLPGIGTNSGLRGYVQDRFTGESAAYFNAELRYQLVDTETSIVPVKVGLKAFYDFGRVSFGGTGESKEWRSGYGFGFYIVPLDESLTLSLTLGFSDEETAYPVFSVGTPLR